MGTVNISFSLNATLDTAPLGRQFDAQATVAGTDFIDSEQEFGDAFTQLTLGQLSSVGSLTIKNLSTLETIALSYNANGTPNFERIPPGGIYHGHPISTTIYAATVGQLEVGRVLKVGHET
jgi:hypothetical protein